ANASSYVTENWRIVPEKDYVLYMNTFQPWLVGSVKKYFSGLKALGVEGPWFLSLSILRAKNVFLVPSHSNHFIHGAVERCNEDDIRAEMISVAADIDLTTDGDAAVFNAMLQALQEVWRHCGYSRVPKFKRAGGENFDWV